MAVNVFGDRDEGDVFRYADADEFEIEDGWVAVISGGELRAMFRAETLIGVELVDG